MSGINDCGGVAGRTAAQVLLSRSGPVNRFIKLLTKHIGIN